MKEISTLSHEIFELFLQLRVLVIDAPYDRMLERAANIHLRLHDLREYIRMPGSFGCSLFLMNLVLPERYSTAADLQYRRRIQARKHGLQLSRNGGRGKGISRARRALGHCSVTMRIHPSAHRLVVVRRMQRRYLG